MVNMINKKTIYCIAIFMIAVVALVLLPSFVSAQTEPTTKTYTIIYKVDDSMGPATGTGDINGETMAQVTLKLEEGQKVNVNDVFK